MANLRDIRRRIKSVKNTAQITKAMQMVAEAKMRRAQQLATALKPYADKLDEIAARLHVRLGSGEFLNPLLQPPSTNAAKTAVLVITSDKGLCGALNSNLLREVLRNDSPEKIYICVGRKGRQTLARLKKNLLADFSLKDSPTFAESKTVSGFILQKFQEGVFNRCEVYHSHYINALIQTPVMSQIIPIGSMVRIAKKAQAQMVDPASFAKSPGDLIPTEFEPDANTLLGKLLPHYLHMEVYQKILDSRASEHSARRVAMKNATDNAKELVKSLTLDYNKARQAAITREILEIASAALALN